MKDWKTLQPDQIRLINKHFTPGRGGQKIQHVTIHHMGGIGDINQCWQWWQTRAASAHYAISRTGHIGQLVWDRDTAWANKNLLSNQRTIAIEHSNDGGAAQDWPISEKTREEGAHLVAAICVYYKLGRPMSGKNVRFHNIESGGATACPYHLRPGGKYHDSYMRRAQYWYDQMTTPKKNPTPAPTPAPSSTPVINDQAKRLEEKIDLILDQLAGPGMDERGRLFSGWEVLGNRTIVNAVAKIMKDLTKLMADLTKLINKLEGK